MHEEQSVITYNVHVCGRWREWVEIRGQKNTTISGEGQTVAHILKQIDRERER